MDYAVFLKSLSRPKKWYNYRSRQIIVMCIDKLAKHKFSGLEEREVWKDRNLEWSDDGKPKVGNKIFRIQ